MNYGEILKKTWKIIWKHKILWLFGILAGCGASASGAGGGGGGGMESFGLVPQVAWSLTAGIFFFVVTFVAVLFLFVRTAGKIGVIKGTQMAD